MEIGDPYIECAEEESPNCTNSVPSNLWTWDDHLTTFTGLDAYKNCKKGQPPVYKLNISLGAGNFFDHFDFVSEGTTVTGFVEWVNRTVAEETGLIYYQNNQVSRKMLLQFGKSFFRIKKCMLSFRSS